MLSNSKYYRVVGFLLIVAVSVARCSLFEPKETELPPPRIDDPEMITTKSLLEGEWEWIHTINYWGPSVTYAANVEYTKQLIFDADSAREYRDGELQWSSAYDTDEGGLRFESRFNTSFGVSDEHLVLSNAALDGPERAFRRIE